MKRVLWGAAIWIGVVGAAAAEGGFSKALRAEEFSAAGLAKLSPQELARLDALVREFKFGAKEAAPPTTEPAAPKRGKVRLTPGAEVEYEAIASRIVGDFFGWEGRRTIFTLENGQRWQVAESNASYNGPKIASPAVKIVPGALGAFWMNVEGVTVRVKVVLLGGAK